MNLPNKLTIQGFCWYLVLLIIVPTRMDNNSSMLSFMSSQLEAVNNFIINYGNYIAAFLFFVDASTDGLNGYIARKRKQVTRFGKFLDPIADKLLVTAALIALVERRELSSWVAVIIIGREFMITGLRLVAASDGIVIAASKWGKIKTVTQIVAILAVLMKYYVHMLFGFPLEMPDVYCHCSNNLFSIRLY